MRSTNRDHVGDGGPDVFGSQVSTAQRIDDFGVRAQHVVVVVAGGATDDDGLAAPEVQARDGCLVRHGLRESQDVIERVTLGIVRIPPRPAERRPEHGGVDGDDAPKSALEVLAEQDLLMTRT